MWFAYVLNYSDRQAIFSMFPVIKTELDLSKFELALIGSVFLWVYGLGCPVAGMLADRFSKRWLVIGSLAIWSVVTTLTGMANSLAVMLVLRVAMGVSESMFMPAAIALTANAHAPHQRSRAIAILTTGQIVGTIVGGSFGGWMAGAGHWRLAFFILGGVGLLYVVPYALFLRSISGSCETNPSAANPSDSATTVAVATSSADRQNQPAGNSRSYILLCFIFPVFVFGLWTIYTWFPIFMFEKFKLSVGQAGVIASTTLQTSMFLGLISGGAIADAWFKHQRRARGLMLVISLTLCAPSLHFLGNSDTATMTCVAAIGFGLFGGFFAGNIFPAAFDVVASEKRASAVGWLNFFGALLSGFAPIFGAAASNSIGMSGMMSCIAGAYLVAAACLAIGVNRWYLQDYLRVH